MDQLEALINASGYKRNHIAGSLGISRFTLRRRLNGETEFNDDEILKLRKLLNLEDNDFFYNQCRQNNQQRKEE